MSPAEFHRRARAEGWTLVRLAKHLELTHPLASRRVITSATPSDVRTYHNTLAEMKRALPPVPPKPAKEPRLKAKAKPAPRRRAAPPPPPPAPASDRRPAPPPPPPYRRPIPGGPAGFRSSWSWL